VCFIKYFIKQIFKFIYIYTLKSVGKKKKMQTTTKMYESIDSSDTMFIHDIPNQDKNTFMINTLGLFSFIICAIAVGCDFLYNMIDVSLITSWMYILMCVCVGIILSTVYIYFTRPHFIRGPFRFAILYFYTMALCFFCFAFEKIWNIWYIRCTLYIYSTLCFVLVLYLLLNSGTTNVKTFECAAYMCIINFFTVCIFANWYAAIIKQVIFCTLVASILGLMTVVHLDTIVSNKHTIHTFYKGDIVLAVFSLFNDFSEWLYFGEKHVPQSIRV